jgi:hypothetical protein
MKEQGGLSIHNEVMFMDVSRIKKMSSLLGGFALALAVSAPASAAWTNLPVPAQYASSVSGVRLCKTQIQVPFVGALWQVNTQVSRFDATVAGHTLYVSRVVGSSSYPVSVFFAFNWNASGVSQATGYGSTTQDDRFTIVMTFADGSTYAYAAVPTAQIAAC